MKSFFNRSLTGIRSLVSDQVSQVESATGKPPKVRGLIWALPVSKLISPGTENSVGRWAGRLPVHLQRPTGTTQKQSPQATSPVSSLTRSQSLSLEFTN